MCGLTYIACDATCAGETLLFENGLHESALCNIRCKNVLGMYLSHEIHGGAFDITVREKLTHTYSKLSNNKTTLWRSGYGQ